jgi:hypothetical protein
MTTFRLSLRQALHGSGDGEARTPACLLLALLLVVVARCSNNLFVIFIIFGYLFITTVDDY